MGTGYTRNDTANNIADGNVINASDLDGEFDAIQSAFNATTGHSHDGTTGEGPKIDTGGLADDAVTAAILDETATFTMAGLSVTGNTTLGDAATDTVTVTADIASDLIPSADGTYDLGASGSEWQDLYIDGTANIDSLVADTADINGSADISGTLSVAAKIDHTGDTDTFFEFSAANTARIVTGNVERLFIDNSGIVINETGADTDFRVEGDTASHMLFVDAGNDRVGIANSAPATALDVTGTVTATGLDVNGAGDVSGNLTVGGNLNLGDNDKAIFGADGELEIFSNGTTAVISETGGGDLYIKGASTRLLNPAADKSYFVGTDAGASTIFYNGQAKLATKSDGVDITGELQADSLDIDGAAVLTIADNTTGLTIVSTDADANSGPRMDFTRDSASPADNDYIGIIRFLGKNSADETTAYSSMTTRIKDVTDGTEDAEFYFSVMKAGTTRTALLMNQDGVVVNEGSADMDFRVESNNLTHALFVDAGNDKIGINESAPDALLHITTNDNATQLKLESTDGDANGGPRIDLVRNSGSPADNDFIGNMRFVGENSASEEVTYADIRTQALDVTDATEDGQLEFRVMQGAALRSYIRMSSDDIVLNDDSRDINLRVESNGNTNAIKVDAGTDKVGIMEGSPSTTLDVGGSVRAKTNTDTSNTGNVQLDFGANQNFVLTLTGNVTLTNPSTEVTGQTGFIIFIQDGTGSRTVSLGTDYETAGGAGLTLSTAANSVDIVPYVVQSAGNILLGAPQLAFS